MQIYTLFINGGARGRVWVEYMKARRKGLPIQMKTKQSKEMRVVSLVILEISRQLGSDSCLLMTAVEIPGFTTADMVVWFRSQHQKSRKMSSKNRIDYLSLFTALYSCTVLIAATLVSFQLKTLEAEYRNRI